MYIFIFIEIFFHKFLQGDLPVGKVCDAQKNIPQFLIRPRQSFVLNVFVSLTTNESNLISYALQFSGEQSALTCLHF